MIGTSQVATSAVSVDWLDLFLRLRAVFFVFVVLPALTYCVVAVVRLYGGYRLRAVRKGGGTVSDGHNCCDEFDKDFHLRAALAADAAYRFMRRVRTVKVVDAGLLDDDVVSDLTQRLDEFMLSRHARVTNARGVRP